jgi:hypothetical protein
LNRRFLAMTGRRCQKLKMQANNHVLMDVDTDGAKQLNCLGSIAPLMALRSTP